MQFEWDPKKATANKRTHGVAFQEASTVFSDPLAITFADPYHLFDEDRSITFHSCLWWDVGCALQDLLIVRHGFPAFCSVYILKHRQIRGS